MLWFFHQFEIIVYFDTLVFWNLRTLFIQNYIIARWNSKFLSFLLFARFLFHHSTIILDKFMTWISFHFLIHGIYSPKPIYNRFGKCICTIPTTWSCKHRNLHKNSFLSIYFHNVHICLLTVSEMHYCYIMIHEELQK